MKKQFYFLLILSLFKLNANAQIISTVVGNGLNCIFNGDSIPASSVIINQVHQIAIDEFDNLYYCDYGCVFSAAARIRKIDKITGLVSTLAGGGTSYSDSIPGDSTYIVSPSGLAVDNLGNVYWSGGSASPIIRKVSQITGLVSTPVGTNNQNCSGDSALATNQTLGQPWGLSFDSAGRLYISDVVCNKVRKVDFSTGLVITAAIGQAWNSTTDSIGNVYFTNQHKIMKFTIATGITTIIAGSTTGGYNGDNILATTAFLNFPHELVFDKFGNLFIADFENHRIRKIDMSTGIITTVVGTGVSGYNGDNILASSATLYRPESIAFDSAGDLFISDLHNFRIRKVMMGPTSLNETNNNLAISVFPNPTSSFTTVSLNGKKIKEIIVVNYLGEIIYQSEINNFNTTIDFTKEAAGIYYIKITDYNNNYGTAKILVN